MMQLDQQGRSGFDLPKKPWYLLYCIEIKGTCTVMPLFGMFDGKEWVNFNEHHQLDQSQFYWYPESIQKLNDER